jgi:tetratricopeptide (TPR) repeat protein
MNLSRKIITLLLIAFMAGCYHDKVNKGTICLNLGDYSTAIEIFSVEVKRHPDRYEARLGLGKALLQRSVDLSDSMDWKEGLLQLEAAISLNPEASVKPVLSDAWLQRGRFLLVKGDSSGCMEALSRSLEYNPRSLDPLNLAGILYFQRGDVKKAEALFSKAVSIDSISAVSRFNLGMVYWYENEIQNAHANWLAALKLSPDDKDVLYWFSCAEKKLRE